MLDTLATPHGYPGRLIVVEGIDGSGKTTQLRLLAKWLAALGHRVSVTEWNSSAPVRTAVRTGKRKNVLTPTTFSLLHATDFADRQLYKIIPPLKAGMNVLADRYDGRRPIDTIQAELQRQVGTFLDAQPSTMDPELRSCG